MRLGYLALTFEWNLGFKKARELNCMPNDKEKKEADHEKGYKYLGVLESDKIKDGKIKLNGKN